MCELWEKTSLLHVIKMGIAEGGRLELCFRCDKWHTLSEFIQSPRLNTSAVLVKMEQLRFFSVLKGFSSLYGIFFQSKTLSKV